MRTRVVYILLVLSMLFNTAASAETVAENDGIKSLIYKALEDKIVFTWQEPDGVKEIQINKFNYKNELLDTITVPSGTEYYKDCIEDYEAFTYEICCIYEDGTESAVRTVKASAAKANKINNWNVFFGANKPNGNDYAWIEIDATEFCEGKQSAKVTYKAAYADRRYASMHQRLSVEPNTEYILRFSYKASGIKSGCAKIDYVRITDFFKSTNQWEETVGSFKTGAAQTSLEIQLVVDQSTNADTTGSIWFDDIQLYRADDKTMSNHIKDGGFEGKSEDLIMSAGEITRQINDSAQWFVNHGRIQKSKLKCGARIANYVSAQEMKALYLYHGNEKTEDLYSGIRLTIPMDTLSSNTEYNVKINGTGTGTAMLYVNGVDIGAVSDETMYSFTTGSVSSDTVIEIRLLETGEFWLDKMLVCMDETQIVSFDFEDEEETFFLNTDVKGYMYGNETVLYAKVSNDSLEEKDAVPIFAQYKDNKLVDVEMGKLYLSSEETKEYYSISDNLDVDEVKLFLWSDMSYLVPLNDGACLRPSELPEYIEVDATEEEFDIIIRSMYEKLKLLADECEEKNIPCDNERAAMYIIERFITYGKDDIANDYQDRANYVRDCLVKMYNEAKSNLNGYLTGEKTPFESVKYVTGTSDSGYKTDLAPSSTGETKRPTWFVGFGHFGEAVNDMELFSNLGLNIIACEILMRDIIKAENSDGEYSVNYEYIDYMKRVLKSAENYNIKVSTLINANRFPDWFKEKYPEIVNENGCLTNTHPKVRELTDVYMGAVLTLLNEHPDAIHDVCLMNEPQSRVGEYNINEFRNWLSVRYENDIVKLNEAYSTDYTSFDEVPMTEAKYTYRTDTTENLNKYYDYLEYNDKNFAEYNEYVYETAKKYAPNLRYNIKIQNVFHEYEIPWYNSSQNKTFRGTDPELIANLYNINGCDACAYVGSAEYSIRSKFEIYDFMSGMNGRPLINSEDHLYWDSDATFTENGMKNVRCDVWQGAMHGRTATAIWLWGRSYGKDTTYNSSIAARPDVLMEIVKACSDLNRLAYETAALNSQKAKAAVYYDKNLIVRKRAAMGLITRSYEALWDCGLKTEFITDDTISKLPQYKMIVLPSTEYMSEKTLAEVEEYISNGGKVYIVSDGDGIVYTEYGTEHNAKLKESILNSAVKITATVSNGEVLTPTLDSLTDTFMGCVSTFSDVILYDENGNYIKDVEYQACEYNDGIIISVCNYDIQNPRTAIISLNGDEYNGTVTDLRTGETMSGMITMDPYQPTILKIAKGGN